MLTTEAALGPIADRSRCRSEPELHRGKDEDDAEADHQQRAERAEKVEVEPDTEAEQGDEHPDRHERAGQPCRKCKMAIAVLADGGREHDRHQWKNAGRQNGKHARDRRENQR